MSDNRRGNSRGGGGRGGRGVTYTKNNDEPAFIKRFKEKVGYKDDSPSVDTKRAARVDSDSDDEERLFEEEKPQVVVLKAGDLTAQEVESILDEDGKQTSIDGEARPIMFRKPQKRPSVDGVPGLNSSTNKKTKPSDEQTDEKQTPSTAGDDKIKKKKKVNMNLLSFEEDEGL